MLAIAIIAAVVRSNESPDEDQKRGSSLADLRLTGLGASAAPGSAMPSPVGSSGIGDVQMMPITVEGQQGLLVRYRAEVLIEPVQQRLAKTIVSKVKSQAEVAGVDVIVIMAVAPGDDDMDSPLAPQTHTVTYKRVVDGTWMQVEEPSVSPRGSGAAAGSATGPAASASAPTPANLEVSPGSRPVP